MSTGNKGVVYRIDSDALYTAWVNAAPTQVTALVPGPGGEALRGHGKCPGKFTKSGRGWNTRGRSSPMSSMRGIFSQWGRLSFKGAAEGGRIAIEARSGNLDRPQKNWSAWSGAITSEEGARMTSPAARFLQWRATLAMDNAGKPEGAPNLDAVEAAYLPRNVAPHV